MANDEENFIPSIYNYCDRWCERCSFTSRCRTFAMEHEFTDAERDIGNEAFWRNLQNIFADAKQSLLEKAEEFGIEINPPGDEEFAEIRRQNKQIRDTDLARLAESYIEKSAALLDVKDDWLIFTACDEEMQIEMLNVIVWYQFFIAAKIQRGLRGITDVEGDTDKEELNNPQSDANGSAKIALIALERSQGAWAALATRENVAQIKPILDLLEIIKQKTEGNFPHARGFIRPGFDEIETVM